jgi:purine-binding chemotaxis protein CheW
MTDDNAKSGYQEQRYLQFSLGSETYAVPLLSVKEVIAFPEVTPIPSMPNYYNGIMNLRGKIISIIDLRTKFGIKCDPNGEKAVIICDLDPLCIGIVVNSVNSVLTLTSEEICPKPDLENSKKCEYITGVAKKDSKLTLLIELSKALDVKDYQMLQKAAESKKTA